MLSCKDVCYTVSESLDKNLPLHRRLGIRAHLLMCIACQQMVQQMKLLRTAAQYYESNGEKESLSKEASARIMTRLRQAKNDRTE